MLIFVIASFAYSSVAEDRPSVHQPPLTQQNSGTQKGLIAVSPVSARVVWAAGGGGTFLVTTNGGETWKSGVVRGAEALQFRDVQGVSEKVAYLLSIGSNPTDFRIYKTENGGETWSLEFENQKMPGLRPADRRQLEYWRRKTVAMPGTPLKRPW